MKEEKCKTKLHSTLSLSTIKSLYLHELLFSWGIDFFLTRSHPKIVYKLDINNHKSVLNEKM